MDTNVHTNTVTCSCLAASVLLIVRISICTGGNFRNEFHRTVRRGYRRGVDRRRKLSRLSSVVGHRNWSKAEAVLERRGEKGETTRTVVSSPRALVTDETDVLRDFARNRAYENEVDALRGDKLFDEISAHHFDFKSRPKSGSPRLISILLCFFFPDDLPWMLHGKKRSSLKLAMITHFLGWIKRRLFLEIVATF